VSFIFLDILSKTISPKYDIDKEIAEGIIDFVITLNNIKNTD
jgi:hypothetical protein